MSRPFKYINNNNKGKSRRAIDKKRELPRRNNK